MSNLTQCGILQNYLEIYRLLHSSLYGLMENFASSSGNQVRSPSWNDLPVELWLEIFKYLSQPHLLFVMRHVCHYFNSLIFDPCLWKSFNLNEWKENASLTQLNLTSEKTNHVFDDFDIDLLTMLLFVNGQLSSTDAFVPIINHVHSFVKSISISTYGGDFVLGEQQQTSLYKCSNLTSLNLAFCDCISPSILKNISQNCSKIDTLIFEGCGNLSDHEMEEISKFQHLEKLDISHCSCVTDVGLSYITNMPCQLKHFISGGVLRLSDQGIIQLVCRQSNIEKLVLDGENLTDISIKLATHNLKELIAFEVLFCSELSNKSIMALTDTTRLQMLTSFTCQLALHHQIPEVIPCRVEKLEPEQLCPARGPHAAGFKDLCGSVDSLKWLHLKKLGEWITTPVITQLFTQDSMRHLNHLTLTDSHSITDITLNAVSIECPDLQHVQFDWCCEITDVGVDKLIKGCRKLRRMLLVGLGRLAGPWLRSLDKYLPHLKMLDLSMCDEIGDEDLFQLVKRKPDLVAFSYFHEQVDTDSVEDLIHLRHFVASPNSQNSNENPPECAGSMGASVDF